jgi:flagellar biosynthesis protein FlhA
VPKLLPLSTVQKVLQNLLDEKVHIRDMRTILETLAENAARSQDADELTAAVRAALGRAIIHEIFGGAQELQVMALEPGLEHILVQALRPAAKSAVGLEPGLAERWSRYRPGRRETGRCRPARGLCWCRRHPVRPALAFPAPLRARLAGHIPCRSP